MSWQGPPQPPYPAHQPPPDPWRPPPTDPAPWPPGDAPPPGRRRPGSKRGPVVVVVAVVVAVAAVGAALVVTGGDGSGDEASSGGEGSSGGGDGGARSEMRAWTAPAVEGDHGEVIRTLTHGSDLIVITQRDATSIDRRTGEQNWFSTLADDDEPGAQYVLCGAGTSATDDGTLPVTIGVDADPAGNYDPVCGVVGLMDLADGTVGPTVDLSAQAGGPTGILNSGMPTEIVGDTVLATWDASVYGLNPADLSTSWHWDGGTEAGREGADCEIDDMAVGESGQVVLMSGCITDRGETLYFVDELSAAGERGRSHQITNDEAQIEISSLDLVSAAPVVVWASPGGAEGGQGSVITLDESWNVLSTIHDERTTVGSDQGLAILTVGFVSNRTGAWRRPSRTLVDGTTMVSFTAPNTGANELVATDLSTGEQAWATAADAGWAFWQVLSIDEDTVVALAAQDGSPNQAVVTVDRASGQVRDQAVTEVIEPDGDPISATMMASQGFLYADGRAYAVEHGDAGEPDEQWLAYTVGTP